jgi:hypothetical protein
MYAAMHFQHMLQCALEEAHAKISPARHIMDGFIVDDRRFDLA